MTWASIKRLARRISLFFCLHAHLTFIRNIYGDEIFFWGGDRSVWKCRRCGQTVTQPHLSQYTKD